jgi:VanZ family protein
MKSIGLYKILDSRLLYLIFLIFWCGIIIHISSIPHLSIRGHGFPVRKLGHIVVYCILAILLWKNIFWQNKHPVKKAFACCIIVLGFAIFDEIHQSVIPGRHGNIQGVFIDMLGTLPLLVWSFIKKIPLQNSL